MPAPRVDYRYAWTGRGPRQAGVASFTSSIEFVINLKYYFLTNKILKKRFHKVFKSLSTIKTP